MTLCRDGSASPLARVAGSQMLDPGDPLLRAGREAPVRGAEVELHGLRAEQQRRRDLGVEPLLTRSRS